MSKHLALLEPSPEYETQLSRFLPSGGVDFLATFLQRGFFPPVTSQDPCWVVMCFLVHCLAARVSLQAKK